MLTLCSDRVGSCVRATKRSVTPISVAEKNCAESLESEAEERRCEVDARAEAARVALMRRALRAQKKPQQAIRYKHAGQQLLQICH